MAPTLTAHDLTARELALATSRVALQAYTLGLVMNRDQARDLARAAIEAYTLALGPSQVAQRTRPREGVA